MTQQQELTASDGAAGDWFGWSVSVSGDTAVMGAVDKNNGRGAAYVFAGSGGVWTQQQELTASDGVAGDYFGGSVSASGSTAVIGAGGRNNAHGAAYAFVSSGGVWGQQQELTASDGAADDHFGGSVSVGGDTAVIGAYGKTVNYSGQGAAYVFVRSAGAWTQQQELAPSDGGANANFGYSVSVSGDAAVIGSTYGSGGLGEAYVFALGGGTWGQQQQLTASDGAANDWFGYSVSVSGDTAVIGAPERNEAQGAAYVFVRPRLGTSALLVGSAASASSVVLSYSGAWTATANDSFLHISPGSASGTGSAVVVFTYDAYTGTGTRTGTLTIAGLTVTVTQAGTNYIGPGPVVTLVSSGLSSPFGVAVDGSGNVYIADTFSQATKEWSAATQQVTTLVSTGLNLPSGAAVDGSGNVYIADTINNAVKEWNAATQQATTLVSTGLFDPMGVAVDGSGNVYIADTNNNVVKERNAPTQQVTTLVSSGLSQPFGAAVDGSGNVYIADTGNSAIREWSAATQQVITLVSSGLSDPRGVAVDGSGNVYIADTYNNTIREWSAATQQVITLVSSGLTTPSGAAVDGSGNVYIADTQDDAIKEIPFAFVGPASLTESPPAGSDSLLQVLPATTNLTGVFAPTSDQGWLTIGAIASGVVSFSFTANASPSARVAHITVLGQQITVTQNGSAQTITFGPLSNQVLGTAPFTISATASSDLPVSFSSQTTSVCTVSGASVTLVSAGTCTIQATQGGNSSYSPAPSVSQSFLVQLAQIITFPTLSNQALGATPFTVSATASSGLAVSFASTTASACTVSGATVTLVALGTCSIQATQAGNATYTAATPVNQSFQVQAPVATLGSSSLGFTNTLVGRASAIQTVTLQNTGNVALTIASIRPTGTDAANYQYTVDATLPCPISPATLSAGASCTLDVAFAPLSAGAHNNAQITITDNSGNVVGATQTVGLTGTGIVLSSIAVTAASTSIANYTTEQFTATGTYSDNSTANLTNLVTWSSSSTNAATINATGLVTALAIGPTNITATLGTVTSNTFQLTIGSGLQFYPLTPCRVADTRTSAGFTGPQGPPYLAGGTSRSFPVVGFCGVPANATAYSLNVTVVPRTGELGFLTTWPTGQPQPLASTLNSPVGEVVANAALVPAGTNGDISIYASDDTDVLFDVNGYFAPPGTSELQFYPLTPCRVADTRQGAGFTGTQGPPSLSGGTSRNFAVAGLCGVPATAAAYSLNVTVVPTGGVLNYLTTWPTGQAKPLASTLNSPGGQVVANAALVPAGTNGDIGIYVSDATDVLFDINGYFAAPGASGLDFYAMTPCRVADTRGYGGFTGQFGPPSMGAATSRSFAVPLSVCSVPTTAAAYSLNVTVVPTNGVLNYLTTWPTGQAKPWASTLNSPDGLVVANAALVPAGTGGAISIYVSDPTDVLFDINGYFAPEQ